MLKKTGLIFSFLMATCSLGWATDLSYEITLQARSGEFSSYRIEAPSIIYNSSPVIDDRGHISFIYMGLDEASQEFRSRVRWQPLAKSERDVYQAKANNFLSSLKTNKHGDLLFLESDAVKTNDVYQWVAKSEQLIRPFSLSDFPKTVSFSELSFAGSDGQEYVWRNLNQLGERSFVSTYQGGSAILKEGEGNVSYLFTPKSNGDFLAAKLRKGQARQWDESRPDQIRSWKVPFEKSSIVAQDQDAKADSPYLGFHNALGISSKGAVAFVATLDLSHRPKGLYLSTHAGEVFEVALEGKGDILEIETFAPMVNANNIVVFRAKDTQSKRSLFVWSHQHGLHKIVGEGDIVPSDVETARIIDTDWGPGLAGNPSLNNKNQIVFQAVLESKNGERRLGSAIYKVDLKL